MLTARQMVIIATRSSVPPLRLSDLSKMYSVKPFSLRTIGNLMQQQKTYLQVQVRDLSLMKSVNSYSELQKSWATAPPPSKSTLQLFAKSLGAAGGSIKELSEFWHEVGIAGNLGSLASLNVYRLDTLAGVAPSAAIGSLHPLVLTEGEQWLAVGTYLVTVGGLLIAVAGLPATLPALAVITAVGLTQSGLATAGIALALGGFVDLSVGMYVVVIDNPSATPSISAPSGSASNLPVDATDAGAGVLSTTGTPDAFASFNLPVLDINNLPTAPPPTAAPGPTPVPTSRPGPTLFPTPLPPTGGPTPSPGPTSPGGTSGPPSTPPPGGTFSPPTTPPPTFTPSPTG